MSSIIMPPTPPVACEPPAKRHETCEHFVPGALGKGMCMAHPPITTLVPNGRPDALGRVVLMPMCAYPVVTGKIRACGEWTPRVTPLDAPELAAAVASEA